MSIIQGVKNEWTTVIFDIFSYFPPIFSFFVCCECSLKKNATRKENSFVELFTSRELFLLMSFSTTCLFWFKFHFFFISQWSDNGPNWADLSFCFCYSSLSGLQNSMVNFPLEKDSMLNLKKKRVVFVNLNLIWATGIGFRICWQGATHNSRHRCWPEKKKREKKVIWIIIVECIWHLCSERGLRATKFSVKLMNGYFQN